MPVALLVFHIMLRLLKVDGCENVNLEQTVAIHVFSLSVPWQHQEGMSENTYNVSSCEVSREV